MPLKHASLRTILPIGIFTLFAVVSGATLLFSLVERRDALLNQARADIQREVAHFSRLAERALAVDPQLVEDNVTQGASDPRVEAVALVSPRGEVLYAGDFSWRGESAATVIDGFSPERFQRVIEHRRAVVEFDPVAERMVATMSYLSPSAGSALRSLDKGAVYLAFDLSRVLERARRVALLQRLPELFTMLLLSLLSAWALNRYLAAPLSRIERAAHAIAEGDFGVEITPGGAREILGLSTAFNRMSGQLARQLGELHDSSEHLRTLLDNVVDGIITIDEVGVVGSFNPAAERIFGYRAEEVVGRNVKMLMPEPTRSRHDDYLARYHHTGEARIIGVGREVEALRKSGERFPMDLAISAIDHRGRPLYIGIVRDITERKRVERMKDEFVSTVSHELRTPLTSIAGSLGLLAGGAMGELPPQVRSMVGIAHKNSERLAHLINDLLDMEKITAGEMEFEIGRHRLMPLVEQALEDNRGYAERCGVRYVLARRVADEAVRVDGGRLAQVLANLLSNAAKFSPEGGVVEVAVTREGGALRIAVRDRGRGIPESFQSRIFQKFSQADASDTRGTGGTGLGLAISKELMERMGGGIGFHSIEGEGSTFYLELPLAEESRA